MPGKLHM
ncbi:hypothetical protein LEMLEM_LOCUS6309 [Lemmus lemmus]